MSAAGDIVAFASVATNLSTLDHDRNYDVYVKHLATGGVVLASASRTGAKANVGGEFPSLSGSGRYVAFQSQSTNLAPADRNRRSDIYVKDLLTGRIALASANAVGRTGNGSSTKPSLSAEGSVVAFVSASTNLDPVDRDPGADIYVKNLLTGEIRVASTSSDGNPGNGGGSANPSLSGDGFRVAFDSAATYLDPADTDELTDVYVKDLQTGQLFLASTSGSGVKGDGASQSPALSGDGATVAFTSGATELDPADRNRLVDVYAVDLCSGELRVVSTSDDGVIGNAGSGNPALSTDGQQAAFDSAATNFDPADSGRFDYHVYLKSLCPGTA